MWLFVLLLASLCFYQSHSCSQLESVPIPASISILADESGPQNEILLDLGSVCMSPRIVFGTACLLFTDPQNKAKDLQLQYLTWPTIK